MVPSINLANTNFRSDDHKRYNSGEWTGGQNKGCNRLITIRAFPQDRDQYFVTLYNLDEDSQWGDRIQISPKRMKIVSSGANEIILCGFGKDPELADRPLQVQENYGVGIKLVDDVISCISYYYHDRNVRIDFLPNNIQTINDIDPDVGRAIELVASYASSYARTQTENTREKQDEDLDWMMKKFAEYSAKMKEVGIIKGSTPEEAMKFKQTVINRVGNCIFNIGQLMAIIDARRSIGKTDSEILDDLITNQ